VYSETGDGLGNCGPLAYMAHLGAGYVTSTVLSIGTVSLTVFALI
jgi:hypothetical protein